MTAYTGEDGEPLGVNPRALIVCPPALEDTALEIVKADRDAAGATNVRKGQAEVIVIPELANESTTWYLADTSRPVKGLIFQLRKAVQLVSKNRTHRRQRVSLAPVPVGHRFARRCRLRPVVPHVAKHRVIPHPPRSVHLSAGRGGLLSPCRNTPPLQTWLS